MDGLYSKRVPCGISSSKKKPATGLKDAAGSCDETETGQLCNQLNHNTKGSKHKSIEKTKHVKPSLHSSSSKETRGKAYKKYTKSVKNSEKKVACFKTESSSVSDDHVIQELDSSASHTGKLKSRSTEIRKEESSLGDQNSELNKSRRKSKGKKIIGVSRNDGCVFELKNSKNVTSSRTNGGSSVKTRKSKGSIKQQLSSVVTELPQTRDLSLNGDYSTGESSTDRANAGFVNDNGRGHYNIDGIADVLLALNRDEQDEELTYEQLVSLETNLFFGGVNFNDQHRDMRLDIDNMSYEELLVLEEKMGTVSTALPEEELSKCIKTSVYESLQLENRKTRPASCVDDSKCSICQEEFKGGDEVGRLGCGHGYHAPCINQWLGLKNWCPICKASPAPA